MSPPSSHGTAAPSDRHAGSRRTFLQVLAGSSLAALAGCVSAAETHLPGDGAGASDGPDDPDPADYRIDRSTLDGRSTGTTVPALNADPGAWEAPAGRVTVATEEAVSEDGALCLETNAGQPQAIARRTFDEPRDFTDRAVSLAVKWDRPREGWHRIALTLRDESGDALVLAQTVEAFALSAWHRFDLGVESVEGDPDLGAITTVDVWTWVEDAASRVYVDEIRTTPTASHSYVILQFDDIYAGAYTEAFPILEEYGVRATAGTIIDAIGAEGHLTRDQMDDLAEAGWEFCSHPHAEETMAEMAPDDLETMLVEYKSWHEAQGFADGLDYIIYPFGEISDANLEVVARYHTLGFKVPQSGYGARVTSPLLCGRTNGDYFEEVREAIDHAERYRTVVPIMYHDVGPDREWSVSVEDFERSMRYIDAADVEVITTGEWLTMLDTDEFSRSGVT